MPYLTNKVTRAALLAVTLAACASGGSQKSAPSASPASEPSLQVVNRSSADMDIYLVRTGQRIRLGLAPNNQTTRFSLSPSLTIGAGTVRFEAVPWLAATPSRTDPRLSSPTPPLLLGRPASVGLRWFPRRS